VRRRQAIGATAGVAGGMRRSCEFIQLVLTAPTACGMLAPSIFRAISCCYAGAVPPASACVRRWQAIGATAGVAGGMRRSCEFIQLVLTAPTACGMLPPSMFRACSCCYAGAVPPASACVRRRQAIGATAGVAGGMRRSCEFIQLVLTAPTACGMLPPSIFPAIFFQLLLLCKCGAASLCLCASKAGNRSYCRCCRWHEA
jgi:hypothetical protein